MSAQKGKGGMKEVPGGSEGQGSGQRLRDLNRELLEGRRGSSGEDIKLHITYKGEASTVDVPREALRYTFEQGEIPTPGEVLHAIDVLEEAEQRIAVAADRGHGAFDPLQVAAWRIFDDARQTHMLNLIYKGVGKDVRVREDFRAGFALEKTDAIAREIAAAVLQRNPETIASGREGLLQHVMGGVVVNLEGLAIETESRRIKVMEEHRIDSGSHVEYTRKEAVHDVRVVRLGTATTRINVAGPAAGVSELMDRAMAQIPKATLERYGAGRTREIFLQYLNTEYLIGHGVRIEG